MKSKRKAAAKPVYESPNYSEEDEINSELDSSDNESLSEQEDNLDELDSLSEDQLEEDEEDIPVIRKPNNKRKKPVIESEEEIEEEEEEEDEFSDDLEVVRNKPMTKRQRAKASQNNPEEYLELPLDTGKKKQLTEEEEQLKKSEVARRRKNQSIQKAEKDKADTINRLLKKQASKTKRVIIDDTTEDKEKPVKKQAANRIRYVQSTKGSELHIPSVYTMEQIFGHHAAVKPSNKQCQVEGCLKDRKYTAKKSGKYVCSLEHYKLVE